MEAIGRLIFPLIEENMFDQLEQSEGGLGYLISLVP